MYRPKYTKMYYILYYTSIKRLVS